MPVFWLMFLSLPGVGILIGAGVMFLVSEVVSLNLAGFLAGMLALNLLLDLALIRFQRHGLGTPSAHDPVGRTASVLQADNDGTPVRARVLLDGVRWRAVSHQRLEAGDRVTVQGRDGLTLRVTARGPEGGERASPPAD